MDHLPALRGPFRPGEILEGGTVHRAPFEATLTVFVVRHATLAGQWIRGCIRELAANVVLDCALGVTPADVAGDSRVLLGECQVSGASGDAETSSDQKVRRNSSSALPPSRQQVTPAMGLVCPRRARSRRRATGDTPGRIRILPAAVDACLMSRWPAQPRAERAARCPLPTINCIQPVDALCRPPKRSSAYPGKSSPDSQRLLWGHHRQPR